MARTTAAKAQATLSLRLESAHLQVGVMCTIGPLRFVGFLNRFRADHAGIELTLSGSLPARLSEALLQGDIDIAVMAKADGFDERLRAEPLYTERFVIACGVGHPFARRNAVAMRDLDGETYLQRMTCECRDVLREQCEACGTNLVRSYRSEREDWIETMVAAGMGVCFLPEYSATHPGLVTRPVQDPEVSREVCLVTVACRRWSSPLASFVQAIRQYQWSESAATLPPLLASEG